MPDSTLSFAPTIARFTGFAADYNRHRPEPPAALAALLSQLTGEALPALVVDLGSGTGLSSRYWAERARRVVGIEPSADMRAEALQQTHAANVEYREGYGHATGLPDRCAQIVICMQALHWMDPQATFAEARRILVSGGAFAAVDYDWPPVTPSWRADQAWRTCNEHATRLEAALPGERPARWDKSGHLGRLQGSGCFRFTRECVLHHVDEGNAERFLGLLRSQGGVMDLLKAGYTEDNLGISELESIARTELGPELRPWYWSTRVRIGVA
jgi:SAM-dependent methyltransferase